MNEEPSAIRGRAPRPCVLVVDDDAQVRRAMQWALEDEGFEVLPAADGDEALRLSAEHPPNLVVLDLTLPTLDGYAVARRLRARRGPAVPVLLVTADGQADRKAERAGAYAFLRKPFDVEDFVRAVRRGLGRGPGS